MSSIKSLIQLLSDKERRKFVAYLNKKNKRHDVRNIELFNALIKGGETNVKSKITANAYNVLYKRLKDSLLDFMANLTLESETATEIQLIKRVVLSRKLLVHGQHKLGIKILSGVEAKANEINHYSILSEVYHTLIEHSHRENTEIQEHLFIKMTENNQLFLEQEKLNMVYASVRLAFKKTDEFDIETLLSEVYTKYSVKTELSANFKNLYQLAVIIDIAGEKTKNYNNIRPFFNDKIKELTNGVFDTEKYIMYHIDLLYIVANIYFRKKEFLLSMSYLERMMEQMKRFNGKFYNSRRIQHTTLKALCYNYTAKHESASQILDELMTENTFDQEELLQPILARVMIHFQQNELKKANSLLSKLQKSDSWYEKRAGQDWLLNRKFIEILLYIELDHLDLVESRISSLIKKYGILLKANPNSQVLNFLKLVQKVYNNPVIVKEKEFAQFVNASITLKSSEEEDIFLISYYAWLKAKMNGEELYGATLRIVGGR
tara:strand:+ start:109 stop:1581 length:1473 start_codon:yes stop_codon:yes gene_type:complete